MTKQVQRRRGTATQHTSFTGAEGELSVNTTNKSVHVHDGATAGGIELARKDGSNVAFTSGTLDGVTIGGTTAGAGTFTNLTATGTTTLVGASTSADITFGDNDKAIFGAGSDLQIYHDGQHSYIRDVGTGLMRLTAQDFLVEGSDGSDIIYGVQGGSTTIYHSGATKLATTSTGVDITGTLTSDGLTVDGDSQFGNSGYLIYNNANPDITLRSVGGASSYGNVILDANGRYGSIQFRTGYDGSAIDNEQRMKIDTNGDISFYEDTGTTAKFFWDASAESLGIGTSSPSGGGNSNLTINGAAATEFNQQVNGVKTALYYADASSVIAGSVTSIPYTFRTANTERMRLNSDGSVHWKPNGTTQAMTLDASGNLLVGTTNTDPIGSLDSGMRIGDGFFNINRNGATGFFGRSSTDGNILQFYKDGSPVGSIGTAGGVLTVGNVNTGGVIFGYNAGHTFIEPSNTSGAATDDLATLGSGTKRFRDLYLSGGVYLGGTGSANKLDDYEEGTFTPVIEGTTTAGTGTYTVQTGEYTKIGNRVFVNISLRWTAHTGTGNMKGSGLPFTVSGSSNSFFAPSFFSYNITTSAGTVLTGYSQGGDTKIVLEEIATGGGATSPIAVDTSGELYITLQYKV